MCNIIFNSCGIFVWEAWVCERGGAACVRGMHVCAAVRPGRGSLLYNIIIKYNKDLIKYIYIILYYIVNHILSVYYCTVWVWVSMLIIKCSYICFYLFCFIKIWFYENSIYINRIFLKRLKLSQSLSQTVQII